MARDLRTLFLDTASSSLFVALLVDGQVAAHRSTLNGRSVADLHPTITTLLLDSGVRIEEIDQFAVVKGPGNWTGVNVGVVAAKMFALPLRKPLVLLSRMRALIEFAPHEASGLALISAGKSALFAAAFARRQPIEAPGHEAPDSESQRLSFDEVSALWAKSSSPNLIAPEMDVNQINLLNLPEARLLITPSADQLRSAVLGQLDSPSALKLEGDDIHLALPDYAGADRTIHTSPGSFR